MLFVTKKRVGGLMELSTVEPVEPGMDVSEKIKKALASPLGQGLAPSVARELGKALNEEVTDLSGSQLKKEIAKLFEEVAHASHSSVLASIDEVDKANFVHIDSAKHFKALQSTGVSVDRNLMADLEKDVESALKHAQSPRKGELIQTGSGIGEDDEGIDIGALVEDCISLLHALTHALPQASKALIFAKKEVSMLAKTLNSIFKVFEKEGPVILDEVDKMYAHIWKMYFFLMITLPLTMLFYAFWAGGFCGGPGTKVDEKKLRRKNAIQKCQGCIADCCRVCCGCHENDWSGEMCFWSVCILLQFVVLFLFIMAILITLIAAIEFFLASGCAQIYLLGDQSICGGVLSALKSFLDTIFAGLSDFPGHCQSKQLLTCQLIGKKMADAAEYTVIGSFMAAVFTFQLLIESGQIHTRAMSRIRLEQEWRERHPDAKKA